MADLRLKVNRNANNLYHGNSASNAQKGHAVKYDTKWIHQRLDDMADDLRKLLGERERNNIKLVGIHSGGCLLYTSPSPRDVEESRMPSSA